MKDDGIISRQEKDPVKKLLVLFSVLVIVFIAVVGINIFFNKKIANDTYKTYINSVREVIQDQKNIESTNAWERLPTNEQREKLRSRWWEIIKYYTLEVPQNQKMSEDQVQAAFDPYFTCINTVGSVNFFLPMAYMKVRTNFSPNYNDGYRYGISRFLVKEAQDISNLPIVKTNVSFQVAFKGRETLMNPNENVKLLVARMDDLMKTFNSREDWVILSLLTNEYDVIARYWQDGNGEIPEKVYKDNADLRNILDYYYAFKNWKIIPTDSKTK